MEHGRPMQGHYVEALVEMSRDIQRRVPRQECYADGLASVTWRLTTYGLMVELCTLVQQNYALGWTCE